MPVCRVYIVAILILLTSCTGVATKPNLPPINTVAHQLHLSSINSIKSFALKGRLGVVTQQKGFSGGIHWQHVDLIGQISSTDNIEVFSPLGAKVAHIVKDLNGVTLTSQDGKTKNAPDAESLTFSALGFKLPLTGLSDWALGRPAPSKIDDLTTDNEGKILSIKQDGWDITFENYSQVDAVFLPNKVLLKSEKVNLKLIISNWNNVKN